MYRWIQCSSVTDLTYIWSINPPFSAAAFLRNPSITGVWRTIQDIRTLTCLGPPDHLSVDQGSNYISREMRETLDVAGVRLGEARVENHGSIGVVRRYHAPVRASYERIRCDMYATVRDLECLKMATFSVNATVGPEGLWRTLFVFCVIPRLARRTPSP